jgi:hypothetical protein
MISFLIQLAIANRVILYAKTFLVSTVFVRFFAKNIKKKYGLLEKWRFLCYNYGKEMKVGAIYAVIRIWTNVFGNNTRIIAKKRTSTRHRRRGEARVFKAFS